MREDDQWMERALTLAENGAGWVNPNPLVGAVLVKNGVLIGEGWHQRYGGLHAERNAIADCIQRCQGDLHSAKVLMRGATLYVTLEPCCHYGKTPPCTEAIIENAIGRVVVGTLDPNPQVAGKGAAMLRQHQITVDIGVLEEKCKKQNEVFFHFITQKRPLVIMKYAMTADGKIATKTGHSQWVTGSEARAHVHETRGRISGIMVGINTVLRDDPLLTYRPAAKDSSRGKSPVRIICDSHLRIPLDSQIVKTAQEIPTIIACTEAGTKEQIAAPAQKVQANHSLFQEKYQLLKDRGVRILELPQQKSSDNKVDLSLLMQRLAEEKIDGILLEGGGELNFNALQSGIVSKLQVYIAGKIFGGRDAKTPVEGSGVELASEGMLWKLEQIQQFGEDILLEYRRKE